MHKCVKRCVTLIEMMIVMFLIALITGIVAYNYQGSLDEGKAFKTRTAIEKLETILNLELSKNPNMNVDNWQTIVRTSPIVKDPNNLIYDGWGKEYQVDIDKERGGVKVTSENLNSYERSHHSQ
jgi:general secretion pathway protein G